MPPKINYQRELETILAGIDPGTRRPTLLLHSCCGPCSSYVLEYLVKYFAITVYYHNPCIAPESEYEHRKTTQYQLISAMNEGGAGIRILDSDYDHSAYLDLVKGHELDTEGGERCHICYEERLRATAAAAKSGGFDWFCTTLTVSPYKSAQWLNQLGLSLQGEYRVPYLVSDFKKKNGYFRSIELSKEYGLYRQNYCGCEFSSRPDGDLEERGGSQ